MLKRSLPKRHHFVPEMLQKRFTDEEGRLHFFRRSAPHLGVQRSTPGQLFVEGHLYSEIAPDGTRDPALEHQFSKLEGRVDAILERVITAARAGSLPSLSPREKADWDRFLFTQWKRVPDLHRSVTTPAALENAIDTLISELRTSHPDRAAELDAMEEPAAKRRLMQNIRVKVLAESGGMVLPVLARRGLAVLRIMIPNKSFVIGSFPVVKLAAQDLHRPGSEMWLPVASDIALGVAHAGQSEALYSLRDGEAVRHLNMSIVKQSTMFAGRSRELVHSLFRPR